MMSSNERWKHRRRLVYIGFYTGLFMVFFGLVTFYWDRQVSSQAIISGTAILTIVLSAYIGGATVDDVKFKDSYKYEDENPDGM